MGGGGAIFLFILAKPENSTYTWSKSNLHRNLPPPGQNQIRTDNFLNRKYGSFLDLKNAFCLFPEDDVYVFDEGFPIRVSLENHGQETNLGNFWGQVARFSK